MTGRKLWRWGSEAASSARTSPGRRATGSPSVTRQQPAVFSMAPRRSAPQDVLPGCFALLLYPSRAALLLWRSRAALLLWRSRAKAPRGSPRLLCSAAHSQQSCSAAYTQQSKAISWGVAGGTRAAGRGYRGSPFAGASEDRSCSGRRRLSRRPPRLSRAHRRRSLGRSPTRRTSPDLDRTRARAAGYGRRRAAAEGSGAGGPRRSSAVLRIRRNRRQGRARRVARAASGTLRGPRDQRGRPRGLGATAVRWWPRASADTSCAQLRDTLGQLRWGLVA